jgi:hypothetical protein
MTFPPSPSLRLIPLVDGRWDGDFIPAGPPPPSVRRRSPSSTTSASQAGSRPPLSTGKEPRPVRRWQHRRRGSAARPPQASRRPLSAGFIAAGMAMIGMLAMSAHAAQDARLPKLPSARNACWQAQPTVIRSAPRGLRARSRSATITDLQQARRIRLSGLGYVATFPRICANRIVLPSGADERR